MRRLTLEIAVATALTLGAILSLASRANANDVMVSGAYARASAVSTAKAGSVYLTVVNHGAETDRLVGVRSDAAESAAIHQTAEDNGVMTMREVTALDLAPGATQEFQPGGTHIMLTGLKSPLRQGDMLHLTLVFEKTGEISIDVPIGSVAATGN